MGDSGAGRGGGVFHFGEGAQSFVEVEEDQDFLMADLGGEFGLVRVQSEFVDFSVFHVDFAELGGVFAVAVELDDLGGLAGAEEAEAFGLEVDDVVEAA
jgi:hypothetical protein